MTDDVTDDHQPFQDDLPLHLTGDLPPAEAAALEAHLAGCPACAEERELLAATLTDLGRVAERADPEVDLRGFYAERIAPHTAPRRWPGRLLRAAAVALVFLGGLLAGRATARAPSPPPTPAVARATPQPPAPAAPAEARRERAYRAAVGSGSGLSRGLLALAELSREE